MAAAGACRKAAGEKFSRSIRTGSNDDDDETSARTKVSVVDERLMQRNDALGSKDDARSIVKGHEQADEQGLLSGQIIPISYVAYCCRCLVQARLTLAIPHLPPTPPILPLSLSLSNSQQDLGITSQDPEAGTHKNVSVHHSCMSRVGPSTNN